MAEEPTTGSDAGAADEQAAGAGEPGVPAGTAAVRRRRTRAAVAAALAVALAGTGIGVSLALSGGSSGGSASPAGAVDELLTAADHSDLLGALDALVPGERDAIKPGLVGLADQLKRLHVLSASADLAHVAGLGFHFADVTTTTHYLSPALAEVSLTGGHATAGYDLAKLPLGSFVTGIAGAALHGSRSNTARASTGRSGIVAVRQDGGWYVSLGYTAAVDSLRAAGQRDVLPPAGGITPAGGSSPDAAVTSFVRSAASFDLRGLIADLAPNEMAALQAYAPRFLAGTDASTARARAAASIQVNELGLSSEPLGDATLVKIDSLGAVVGVRSIRLTMTFAGRCVTIALPAKTKRECATGAERTKALALVPAPLRPILERLSGVRPDTGIVTVEVDGQWYVSPTRTLLQDLDAELGVFRPQDLATIAADWATIVRDLERSGRSLALGALSANAIG
ncbi:MAG TPA: hypothetical protein VMU75_11435 [Acidimicrobiales bacterium]|nr:hypothetical protein [Acidimicrobiales bacterium]